MPRNSVTLLAFLAALPGTGMCGQTQDSFATFDEAPCWIEDAGSVGGQVWLLCDRETVYISGDGGKTWRGSRLPSDIRLRSLAVLDDKRGMTVGDNGTLFSSADAGKTWDTAKLPTTENLRDVTHVGKSIWIAGHGGVILHSADGGVSWKVQSTGTRISLEGIFFLDNKNGWAVGWNGTIVRTTDGGEKWEPIRSSAAMRSLNAIYFRDTQNGWAVGVSGQLIRSRDGGVTWEAQSLPVSNSLSSIYFDGAGRGWMTAENDLLVTENGGENWNAVGLKDVWLFLESVLTVQQSLWAVGPFGILKWDQDRKEWTRLNTLPKSS